MIIYEAYIIGMNSHMDHMTCREEHERQIDSEICRHTVKLNGTPNKIYILNLNSRAQIHYKIKKETKDEG